MAFDRKAQAACLFAAILVAALAGAGASAFADVGGQGGGAMRGVEAIPDDLYYYDADAGSMTYQRPAERRTAVPYHDAGDWLEPGEFANYRAVVVSTLRGSEGLRSWTEEDVAAILPWVRAGGTLLFTGTSLYSLAGNNRNLTTLEPLLGGRHYATVRQEGAILAPRHPLVRHISDAHGWFNHAMQLGNLTTATPVAGTAEAPVISINEIGQGRVIYIGSQLANIADSADQAALAGVFRAALQMAGLSPVPADDLEGGEPQIALFGAQRGRRTVEWLAANLLENWETGYPAVSLLLSKGIYPQSDGWLDAMVWLDEAQGRMVARHPEQDPLVPSRREETPAGRLSLAVLAENGDVLAQAALGGPDAAPLPGHQTFFSFRLPETDEERAFLFRAVWRGRDGAELGRAESRFRVRPDNPAASGRVPLHVANREGISAKGVPFTVGVPLPRGAVHDPENVRLVDAEGREMPLQTLPTGHWARFGAIRWLLCDFSAELDGGPASFYLEYGPGIRRAEVAPVQVSERNEGFPRVEAGRVRLGPDGLAWDVSGEGDFRTVLTREALRGAFVERVGGKAYAVPANTQWTIEERGPQKAVLRAAGWYESEADGERFCQFDIRWLIYRDAPFVRVLHTWIYTGDSNDPDDRIANMGWRFPAGQRAEREGFLASFAEPGSRIARDNLLQYDDSAFEAWGGGERHQGERAPGAMSATVGGVRLSLGTKDFWQNYPSELAFEGDALAFYSWPRHGRPRREEPESTGRAWRLDFAHTGEAMDLAVPETYTHMSSERGHHFREGRPDSVNAQGVSRTSEIWIAFQPAESDRAEADRLLNILDGELLRAVADPAWLRRTEAMYEIHPYDPENFPEEEKLYEMYARKPMRQVEHMGVYGMWMWGDLLRTPDLEERTANLYRAFRKGHHGWPYSWAPFARTGDPEYFKFAEAAARFMTDVAFCHYFTEELNEYMGREVGAGYFRARGWWNRNLIPWAGFRGPSTLMYTDGGMYLWHSWWLMGYRRSVDVALAWAEEVKRPDGRYGRGHTATPSPRGRDNLKQQFTEWYLATWDPWFLVAAHSLAEYYLEPDRRGRNWRTGHREFHRWFGEGTPHEEAFWRTVEHHADQRTAPWAGRNLTQFSPTAYAYQLTRDERYLRRLVAEVEHYRSKVYDGGPEAYTGVGLNSTTSEDMACTGWFLQRLPYALAALAEAGPEADGLAPLPKAFNQAFLADEEDEGQERGNLYPRMLIRKEAGESVSLHLRGARGGSGYGFRATSPLGEVVASGEELGDAALPAEGPAGVYEVRFVGPLLQRHRSVFIYYPTVRIPLTPPGTKEVLAVPESGPVPRGHFFRQYYFYVPEGVESFWMEFKLRAPFREVGRRISIWNPDGILAWNLQRLTKDAGDEESVRAEIAVPPEHTGRLWQVTLPGISYRFTFDPRIPPYFAHSPDRWFDPAGK